MCARRNKTARGLDRAQELSRHVRVAKQQPPIVMAALLNHLFSAQVLGLSIAHTISCPATDN